MKFWASIALIVIVLFNPSGAVSQTPQQTYNNFKQEVINNYSSFRRECNRQYAEFLRQAWNRYEAETAVTKPLDKDVIPPVPYQNNEPIVHRDITPVKIEPIQTLPQPKPIEPVRENTVEEMESVPVRFYGLKCNVRMPRRANLSLKDCSGESIAEAWNILSSDFTNNTIRDCLETRIRYKLCDWAYLEFLNQLSQQFCSDANAATLLMAYLYCQSGYQMRLANDNDRLVMLYGSSNQIYDKKYYMLNNQAFYPYGDVSSSLRICEAAYRGETPLSLQIHSEQLLGDDMTPQRDICSTKYPDMSIRSQTPIELIQFFDQYPTSSYDNNPLTRWALYANTPLSQKTKETIYPALQAVIDDCSEVEAANKLLNWVQTGFVYDYDDKIWGHDRAFFAEETLYYPFCDCEDRAILFSRLVRDLLNLDVLLVYYPGHLATAVKFNEQMQGDVITIDKNSYVVCDPTYINAPVGCHMPGLEYDKVQVIELSR